MGNSEFRKPLTQSAAILCGVVIILTLVSSSNPGGAVLAFFSGTGNLILLLIGLSIALPLSIAILVAIFLGAVSLQSREKAAEMYSDLKKNIPAIFQPFTNRWSCCSSDPNSSISKKESPLLEQEVTQLKENSVILEAKINGLDAGNIVVSNNLAEVIEHNTKSFAEVTEKTNKGLAEITEQNIALKEQLDELNHTVIKLKDTEKELNETITTLRSRFDKIKDNELREQIVTLGLLHTKTNTNIDNLAGRLRALEVNTKQTPTSGIFSYIKSKDDQKNFTKAVQDALSQEMTYSEIDEFLSNNLHTKLDKIIKDHPSLTTNYIRNLKR